MTTSAPLDGLDLTRAIIMLRAELRLTQSQMAVRLGIAARSVARYESGDRGVSAKSLMQLLKLARMSQYPQVAEAFKAALRERIGIEPPVDTEKMPRDTEETVIEWVSGVNQKGEPFVQLVKLYSQSGKRDIIGQFDPWQARDCALNALSAAEAAQTDALLMKFLKERLGVTDPAQFGPFMLDFRNLRAQFGTSEPAGPEHWNAVMDDIAVQRTGKPFDPTKKQ